MKNQLLLSIFSILFGLSSQAAEKPAPKGTAWPQFNPATARALMAQTATSAGDSASSAVKVGSESAVAQSQFDEDEVYEQELMRVLPGKPLTMQQKKDLSEFINIGWHLESSNNYFACEAAQPLEYCSVVARAKVVMQATGLKVDSVPGLKDVENRTLKRSDFVERFIESAPKYAHPMMQQQDAFESNPFAITLSYVKPSSSLILMNKALRYSGGFGIPTFAQMLLVQGANPNATNVEGSTPLIRVVARRHNLALPLADFDRKLAEEESMIAGNRGLQGAKATTATGNAAVVNELIKYGAQVNTATHGGITALHAACAHADLTMTEALLKSPTVLDLNAVSEDGYTPLMYVGRDLHNDSSERYMILGQLLAYAHKKRIPLSPANQYMKFTYYKFTVNDATPQELKGMVEMHEEMVNHHARLNVIQKFKIKNAKTPQLTAVAENNNSKNLWHTLAQREVGTSKLRIKFKPKPRASSADNKACQDDGKATEAQSQG